ncbi:MAG: hypothetical protein DYG88_07275 [Chloroflexi bacterium CFX4]|nr:hypothetical protein [Chloroflexi bacterium CFX4]MDL1921985.1 hypothetical protein [Chloroflexi bacterium CFX3]
MTDFPNYGAWLAELTQRDNGLAFVALLAALGVVWAANARFQFRSLLAPFRTAVPILFYGSLCVVWWVTQ